eukprot:TRINITY_DN13166_c0_g1_i1.p1 TRINITY_DN13166_c0_g1~~TRINITY_DN13166_c0_g1_i1.p1  ORF type:complete len:601 (+),score=80.55 TRINITY_DN13166_c0_g1_i1:63-1805(+)
MVAMNVVSDVEKSLDVPLSPVGPLAVPVEETLKWNLTFEDFAAEAAFVKNRRRRLEREVALLGKISTVAFLVTLAVSSSFTLNDAIRAPSLNTASLFAGVFAWILIVALVGWSRHVSDSVFEVSVVCILAVATFMSYCADPRYLRQFVGFEPGTIADEAAFHVNDAGAILAMLNILCASHLCLPLRWIVLLPLEIFNVVVYASLMLMRISRDSESSGLTNLCLLISLTFALSRGKRLVEIKERADVVKLISEKVHRCKSEHRLSHAEELLKSQQPRLPEQKADSASIASTTETGCVFQDVTDWNAIVGIGLRERWLIRASELMVHVDERLGEGGFGVVVGGKYLGAQVAVKFAWKANEIRHDSSRLISLLNELRILRHVRHPSIVGFIGACIDTASNDLGLVLEKVNGTSLDVFMTDVMECPEETVTERGSLIGDIGSAVRYLHSRNPCIIHGDLKDTNIIVSDVGMGDGSTKLICKILDFGLSRIVTRHAKALGGSRKWVAPEVLRGGIPSPAADVFAFGKIMMFIMTGRLLDETENREQLSMHQGAMMNYLLPAVEACLEADLDRRPSICRVLELLGF